MQLEVQVQTLGQPLLFLLQGQPQSAQLHGLRDRLFFVTQGTEEISDSSAYDPPRLAAESQNFVPGKW